MNPSHEGATYIAPIRHSEVNTTFLKYNELNHEVVHDNTINAQLLGIVSTLASLDARLTALGV